MKRSSTYWPQLYLCVALTTMATLLTELSLTRIFSVVFYYHFAFLAISIALFGLGAGGVFSYVVAGWKAPLFTKLGHLSALNSLLVLVSLLAALGQPRSPSNLSLAVVYFATALPFFLSGAIVSLAISDGIERVNRVYFFDLLGAAGGCLLLVPLLNTFGGPNTVIAAAIMFAAVAAIWHTMADSVRSRVASVALALALVALIAYNLRSHVIDLRTAKGMDLPAESFVHWNSFSRVAVAAAAGENREDIRIDADAATSIAKFDFERLSDKDRAELLTQGPALPYAIRPGAKTLIIGAGGGWDIARALASGSHDVTGVEINPIIADTIMRQRFPAKSNGIYLRPDVHIYVEDGRSFVRRSPERYQVLQATLVDTRASTAAGAFALSENSLYTTDAFRDYLSHLTDDGMAVFTRWGFDPPRESLRLLSLAIDALHQLGEADPWRHVIVAREGSVKPRGARDTVIVSRKPLVGADIERAKAALAAGRMEAIYLPDERIPNQFTGLLHSADPVVFQRNYPFDITPVSDNRPYFFYTVQPRDLLAFMRSASRDSADYKINKAVPLLFGLMGVSIAATALILLLPPVLLGTRLPRQRGVVGFLMFFLFIGVGYILIEIALIQKFVLFLGHPTYALTVVIFSMLASSGAGSGLSRRVVGKSEGRMIKALGSIALLACGLALVVSAILGQLVGLPLAVKMAVTVVLIAPLGFVMGMPFPAALQRLEEWHPASVRWAWSLNAASSVLGSVGALVFSIYLGLTQTLVMGGVFYLAALAVAARATARHEPARPAGDGRVLLAK